MACYNRVNVTLRALAGLFAAAASLPELVIDVFLVDDNSADQTGKIVAAAFPSVRVFFGTGSLFWNRGMCVAYSRAMLVGGFDAYLLLNDDVQLIPDQFTDLVETFCKRNREKPTAVTGAMCSVATGETTYSGFRMPSRLRPLTLTMIQPSHEIQRCDTFNGNCVLVPANVMDRLGGLDTRYRHAFGDIDLGLMLRAAGCEILLLSGYIGRCERDHARASPPRELRLRFKKLTSPPFPVWDYIHYVLKHSHWPWSWLLSIRHIVLRITEALFPTT